MRRPARIGILLCLGLSVLLMLASRPEFGGRIDGPAQSGGNGSLAPEQVSVSPPAVVASSPETAPPAAPASIETAPPADPTAAPALAETAPPADPTAAPALAETAPPANPIAPPASAETGRQAVPAAVTADKARAPLPLPAEQITALLTRGDAFVRTRDIASARLFYERAADAGNGRAALRMGESFDRAFLDSIGIYRMIGDRQLALSWYRRARDLGDTEAAQLLHKLEPR
jgi:TPR repeat protein